MKIDSIHIQNFRGIHDQTIGMNDYTCFVGPNGAGKSTVLAALSLFFLEKSPSVDPRNLTQDDFHDRKTDDPIQITVTFTDLSDRATEGLAHYVRSGSLTITTEVTWDADSERASIRQYGKRLGLTAFVPYFDAESAKAPAAELKSHYGDIRQHHEELPDVTTKPKMAKALRDYEAAHPDDCVLINSGDNLFGVQGTHRLSQYVQWVFVPAVKE